MIRIHHFPLQRDFYYVPVTLSETNTRVRSPPQTSVSEDRRHREMVLIHGSSEYLHLGMRSKATMAQPFRVL